MALGVRKRRHCDRGERGQSAPRVTLPLRSLCILAVAYALYVGSDLDIAHAVIVAPQSWMDDTAD